MDRNIVYPGSIPLDTDLLTINRNTMAAIGYIVQAVFGTSPVADGLACVPTVPPSMTISIGGGSITQLSVVDQNGYGSLPSDAAEPLVKMGINSTPVSFALTAPSSSGQAVNYLIQAAFQETDANPVLLPYYNASNPVQPFSGPNNTGSPQNTSRIQRVQLQAKAGPAAPLGTQITPAADAGWVGLYLITVSYGQSVIDTASIQVLPTAPFLYWKLPRLRPGFGSGTQSFSTTGAFSVPPGVTQVEVEVCGAGSGSFASLPGAPSGGGAGGGYARKRITGLIPGQQITVTVGSGGNGGIAGGAGPSAGGTSSFGTFVSAGGGALNPLASVAAPQNGATPGGMGAGGDVNYGGSAGSAGFSNQGGMGGSSPLGGGQNSGTTGNPGVFPGGGASGAGTGAAGTAAFNGAAGAQGIVVVRW